MKPVPSRSHRLVRVCLLVALGGACGAEPEAPPDPVAPRCADPAQAPIDDSRARNGCVTVGASGGAAPGEFADPGTPGALPSPIRYVRAGAAAGGDGSRERPFATLAEATAREPTGTLLLARGTHPVDAAARLRGAFAVVGAGVGVTTLRVTRGRAALEAVGAGQDGLLRGFTVEATAAGGGGAEAAIECRDGAALRGRDLRVRGALVGLRASGLDATLDLDGVTVLGAVSVGVASVDGARVRLQRSLVRDGENYGLFAGSSAGRTRRTRWWRATAATGWCSRARRGPARGRRPAPTTRWRRAASSTASTASPCRTTGRRASRCPARATSTRGASW